MISEMVNEMRMTEYHGARLEPPNVRYTLSFVTGDIIDWDVRHFFDKITTVKMSLRSEKIK